MSNLELEQKLEKLEKRMTVFEGRVQTQSNERIEKIKALINTNPLVSVQNALKAIHDNL